MAAIEFIQPDLYAFRRKLVGYLQIRPLGILDSIIGINFGLGLAGASSGDWMALVEVYFVFGFVLWYGLYLLNDLCDLEEDARHPEKSKRPLVLRKLTRRDANVIIPAHLALALLWSYRISTVLLILTTLTILQQYIYCVRPIRLKRFTLVGILFAGVVGWIARFLVGWTLVRPLNEAPWIFCVFLILFTYGGYLHRRIDYQIQIRAPFTAQTARRMNILIGGCFVSAIMLFIYMAFSGYISRSFLVLALLYGLLLLLLSLTLRKTRGLRRFEDAVVVTTLLMSFFFLLWH